MGLESVTYVEDLVETNPVGDLDPRSEGDDHIKNLKKALKNTFPGMAGRSWRRVNRNAGGSISRTENMTLQNCTTVGITLIPAGASTLGNGWMCLVRAPASGSVNIDAAENINGSGAAYVVPAAHMCMLWCDGTEFYAVIMYESTPASTPTFPSGTKMVFQQTAAPTGWTKVTTGTHDNAALRIVTGSVGTGGDQAFTTAFASGRRADGHALTVAQMPPHVHGGGRDGQANGVGPGWGAGAATVLSNRVNTDSAGSGSAHDHGLPSFAVKYVDFIVASKD